MKGCHIANHEALNGSQPVIASLYHFDPNKAVAPSLAADDPFGQRKARKPIPARYPTARRFENFLARIEASALSMGTRQGQARATRPRVVDLWQ